jgi:hypothetical protein
VLALGLGFWAADPVGRAHPAVAVVSLVFLLGLAILHLLLFDHRAAALAGRWLGAGSRFVPRRIVAALGALPAAAARFGDLPARGRAQVVLLCLARQLVGVVSLFCFARALHLPLSIVNAGWVRSLVLLVAMLPISFAGLGVREGTLIAALQPYGIGAAAAVALALVMFARDLVGAAAGGVLEARRLFAGPNVEAAQ